MHKPDLEELMAFKAPKQPQYKLVSSLDGISLLRRDLKSLLAPEDLDRSVPVDNGERPLGGLADLSSHAILDRGRVVGLWEVDPAAAQIVWIGFIKSDTALKKAVGRRRLTSATKSATHGRSRLTVRRAASRSSGPSGPRADPIRHGPSFAPLPSDGPNKKLPNKANLAQRLSAQCITA